jgi:hypothetical protein
MISTVEVMMQLFYLKKKQQEQQLAINAPVKK